jgi:hypothetical protein
MAPRLVLACFVVLASCAHAPAPPQNTEPGVHATPAMQPAPADAGVAQPEASVDANAPTEDQIVQGLRDDRWCAALVPLLEKPGRLRVPGPMGTTQLAFRVRLRATCLDALVALVQNRAGLSARANEILGAYCTELLKFVRYSCIVNRSAACESNVARLEETGAACETHRPAAVDLQRQAHDTDARVWQVAREANELLERRRELCEAQNRKSRCLWARFEAKLHSSPRPMNLEMDTNAWFFTEEEHEQHYRQCAVPVTRDCPSTRARDARTVALGKQISALLARIDDEGRRRQLCGAWIDVSTYCDPRGMYDRIVVSPDAGAR